MCRMNIEIRTAMTAKKYFILKINTSYSLYPSGESVQPGWAEELLMMKRSRERIKGIGFMEGKGVGEWEMGEFDTK